MPDVVSKVEESANGMQVDWKFAYKDLLTMLNNLKEQLPNDAYGPGEFYCCYNEFASDILRDKNAVVLCIC